AYAMMTTPSISFCALFVFVLLSSFNATATAAIYTLSLHDALPICGGEVAVAVVGHRREVGPHDAAGVEQAGAVLDGQPGPGGGVGAAPDLGAVVEHAAGEAGAAAGAVSQQQVGEGPGPPAPQRVQGQRTAGMAGRRAGPHGAAGVGQAGAVLEGQPGPGVGVVAAPDLGAVVEHAAVEAGAAAGAVFQQQVGEGLGHPALQLVQAQHIAVIDLALAGGGQGRAVDVGQGPVHVPFQILDGAAAQYLLHLLPDAVHHLRAAQVQVVLVTDLAGLAARHRKGPVRVGAVQIAVGADRLWLDPKAQAQV